MNKQFVSSVLVQVKKEGREERYLPVIDVVYCCTLDAKPHYLFFSSFLILDEEKKDFFPLILIYGL
jgi:hypothetical protein